MKAGLRATGFYLRTYARHKALCLRARATANGSNAEKIVFCSPHCAFYTFVNPTFRFGNHDTRCLTVRPFCLTAATKQRPADGFIKNGTRYVGILLRAVITEHGEPRREKTYEYVELCFSLVPFLSLFLRHSCDEIPLVDPANANARNTRDVSPKRGSSACPSSLGADKGGGVLEGGVSHRNDFLSGYAPRSPRWSGLKIRRPAAELLSRIDMKGTHRGNVERQTCLVLSLFSLFYSFFFSVFLRRHRGEFSPARNEMSRTLQISLATTFAARVTRDSLDVSMCQNFFPNK